MTVQQLSVFCSELLLTTLHTCLLFCLIKDMSDDLDDLNFFNQKKKKKKTKKDKIFENELEEGMKVRILECSAKLCCIMGISRKLSVCLLVSIHQNCDDDKNAHVSRIDPA